MSHDLDILVVARCSCGWEHEARNVEDCHSEWGRHLAHHLGPLDGPIVDTTERRLSVVKDEDGAS